MVEKFCVLTNSRIIEFVNIYYSIFKFKDGSYVYDKAENLIYFDNKYPITNNRKAILEYFKTIKKEDFEELFPIQMPIFTWEIDTKIKDFLLEAGHEIIEIDKEYNLHTLRSLYSEIKNKNALEIFRRKPVEKFIYGLIFVFIQERMKDEKILSYLQG